MIPSACASATASHASSIHAAAVATGSGPTRRRRDSRFSPSSSAMTMYGSPFSSEPLSITRAVRERAVVDHSRRLSALQERGGLRLAEEAAADLRVVHNRARHQLNHLTL